MQACFLLIIMLTDGSEDIYGYGSIISMSDNITTTPILKANSPQKHRPSRESPQYNLSEQHIELWWTRSNVAGGVVRLRFGWTDLLLH